MNLLFPSIFRKLAGLTFCFNPSGRSGRNCLPSPPVLSGYNGSPDTRFSPWNDVVIELARRRALLVPSAILCSLSPLISRIHSSLFLDWRRTVFSIFFDTHIFFDFHRGSRASSSCSLCSFSFSLQRIQPTVKLLSL